MCWWLSIIYPVTNKETKKKLKQQKHILWEENTQTKNEKKKHRVLLKRNGNGFGWIEFVETTFINKMNWITLFECFIFVAFSFRCMI